MMSSYKTLVEQFNLALGGHENGAVNFDLLLQALANLAVSCGVDQEKSEIYIDSEAAAISGLRDSGIEDFGNDVTKESVKDENREYDIAKESAGEDQGTSDDEEAKGNEDDDQKEKTKRSSDRETQASLSSASETKVKAEPKSKEEQIPQDTRSTPQGMQEGWSYLRLNGLVEGLDRGVAELCQIIDLVVTKLNDSKTKSAETSDIVQILVNDLQSCTERTTKLEENVTALTTSLDDSKNQMIKEIERLEVSLHEGVESTKEELLTNMDVINTKISDVQDSITPREDFSELVVRVEQLEKEKVNRDELGRLMEEGFIESFIQEQESLRTELETLQAGVTEVDSDAKALTKRLEEIQTHFEDSSDEVESTLETMKQKLNALDADDINDTFAKLENQTEQITKDMECLTNSGNRIEKEAEVNFKKFSDLRESLNKLETSKIDKSKMYEVLDLKADLESLMSKLDRSEFVSVMLSIDEKVNALTSKVEVTEKNLEEGLAETRRKLSFKMYTEDFIPATDPMRNRIKALIYELQKVKELVRVQFLPDAPGVTKCFSCKRAANLINEDNHQKRFKSPNQPESKDEETQSNGERLKLPPIDLDSVPFPPADKPRTQDLYKLPGQKLPAIFADAKPQVGLKFPKKRQEIDREISEFFVGVQQKKAIGGAHTKTLPQQRGSKFNKKTFPAEQMSKVLIEGSDKRIYKGTISKEASRNLPGNNEENAKDEGKKNSEEQSYNYEYRKVVYPTPVVLHRGSVPVSGTKFVPMPAPK